ncbi:MAG TPA: CHAT domain-containing tetratricopeptide repeat protein [Stellaceae bacterium]|nr:CHAT domain-containing tetratricopeptide repeat protein [Stellaceae bacterium]
MRRTGLVMLFLLGAAAMLSASGGRAPAETLLGKSLAGESCQWGPATETGTARGTTKVMPIRCGADASAGTLFVAPLPAPLPEAAAARTAAITAAAKAVPGGIGDTTAPRRCDAGHDLAGDSDSRLYLCVLTSSGWPRIVLVTVVERILYEADGVPALLPVLQAAIANQSGRPFSAAATEVAIHVIEARFPGEMARAGGAEVATYKALIELGRLDGAAHDYAGAEAAYRRVLEIETRLFGPHAIAVGETLAELALQVSNQGRFDEAAGLFRRAAPIINAAPDLALQARLASYRALDAANQRHFADAIKYARAAAQMRRQALDAGGGPGSTAQANDSRAPFGSRAELAHSLRIEAMMALRLGDLSTALADATEVLRIVNDEPSLPLWWRPASVSMMAEIDAQRQRVIPAEREFREVIAMEKKLFGDTSPTALSEMRLGTFYADQQVYGAAVDAYHPALTILEADPVARAAIGPDQIVPFLTATAALIRNEPERRAALDADAFRASQLIGSDVADRTIARAAARLGADNPALAELLGKAQDAQRRRDNLRMELAAEIVKPDDRRDPALERRLNDQLNLAAKQADVLMAKVSSAYPGYAKLADPGPAPLTAMTQQLHKGEAFLSYVVGTYRAFALLVTPDGLTLAPVDLTTAKLDADVRELRRALTPRLGKPGEFDLQADYEFYHRLLGPIEAQLRGVDHLIVAPSGALASLPLAMLVTSAPGSDARHDYMRAAWLVRRMAVSEVPSARAFLSLRAAARDHVPAPQPLLAIADPSFTGPVGDGSTALDALADRCRENGPMAASLLRALPPLKETAAEVEAVARSLGAGNNALLLGNAATERNLRAHPLGQYRVLYFATHGLLPGELHCQAEPALVLSPPATTARSTDDDGLLEASEIAGLKLDADLVVLSACNTAASGGGFGGEALAGLAGAFFNAGARAVLASHWEVPSLATERLMTGLFQDLAHDGGHGLAQALRQSQLRLIADAATAHPFDWAAFTVIGDGDSGVHMAVAPPATKEAERGRL